MKLLLEMETRLRQGYKKMKAGKYRKIKNRLFDEDNGRCVQGACYPPITSSRYASFAFPVFEKQWREVFFDGSNDFRDCPPAALVRQNNETDKDLPELAELMRERVLKLYGVDIATDIKKMTEEIINEEVVNV